MPRRKFHTEEERQEAQRAAKRESTRKYYEDPENRQRHIDASMASYAKVMADPEKAAARRARGNAAGHRFREKHRDDPEYKAKVNATHTEWRKKQLSDPETLAKLREREQRIRDQNRLMGKVSYTTDYTHIENYDEAIKVGFDPKKFVCHHKLENYYRQETLVAMDRYRKLPASELVWMDTKEHGEDRSVSGFAPLDSKYHKSIFDIIKSTVEMADRSKLPKEFDELVSDVEEHYFDYLTEEYLGRESVAEFMEIYHKIEEFKRTFLHYYMAMYLVEKGKKKIW